MNPQDPAPNPHTHVDNNLSVMQPGERTLFIIKRHPIGIFSIYVMCGLVLVVTAVLAFVIGPSVFGNDNTTQSMLAGALVFIVVAAICVTYALISTKVYWGNTWTLTSDSLTQVNQVSLFRRQSSQLAVDDIEDVTAEQNGILTHMFNYGVLKVETAGERSKFMCMYCPNPNYYAQQVLAAREAFEQHDLGETGHRQAEPQPQPAAYQPPAAPAPLPVPEPMPVALPQPEPLVPVAKIAQAPQVPAGRTSGGDDQPQPSQPEPGSNDDDIPDISANTSIRY